MSKTYILEPVELTFTGGKSQCNGILDIDIREYVEGLKASVDDITLLYAGEIMEDGTSKNVFTKNGGQYVSDEDYLKVYTVLQPPGPDSGQIIIVPYAEILDKTTGSHTISVYTETEDKPYIDTNLSKNVTHNDHPYNAVERIRSKLKQKADQEGSGGGSGLKIYDAAVDEDLRMIYVPDFTIHDQTEMEQMFNKAFPDEPYIIKVVQGTDVTFCYLSDHSLVSTDDPTSNSALLITYMGNISGAYEHTSAGEYLFVLSHQS